MSRPLPPLLLLLLAAPAAAQQLPPAELAKLKAATVFVKVRIDWNGRQFASSGSGFLVAADGRTGYVVTNDHVVTAKVGSGDGKPLPTTVELVFDSGTPTEWAAPAAVAALDSNRDLAVLKLTAPKKLPAPIPLDGPERVPETTPVFVCGFPFGDMLAVGAKNPEISVGLGSVSATRTDARGRIERVDLNGSINPGNSGGPVVTADGKLVGVATAVTRSERGGAGIGLAVPRQQVADALRGRVTFVRDPVYQSRRWLDDRRGELQAWVIDPLGKLTGVTAHLAPAGPADAPPADVSKLPGAVPVDLAADPEFGPQARRGEVKFPEGATAVWVQPSWTAADGKPGRGPAARVPVLTAADFDKLSAPEPKEMPEEPEAKKEERAKPAKTSTTKEKPPAPKPAETPRRAEKPASDAGESPLLPTLVGLGMFTVVGGAIILFVAARMKNKPAARRTSPPSADDNPFA